MSQSVLRPVMARAATPAGLAASARPGLDGPEWRGFAWSLGTLFATVVLGTLAILRVFGA